MTDRLKTYDTALKWLFYSLPVSASQIFQAEKSHEVSARLLESIGNPQNNYPTIHVAGTSGKGSTVALVSELLLSNGNKVGSIYSPHVYDFRERFLVNGGFVDKSEVLESTRQLKTAVDKLNVERIFPSYYQVTVALAYLIFANHQLDYLVIETGLGGLYDTTNHVIRDDKVVLLNSIGLDHTEILGETVEAIAMQKAGIINDNSTVFAVSQTAEINEVFREQASLRGAHKFELIKNIAIGDGFSREMETNMSLAVRACEFVATRDGWHFDKVVTERVARSFSLPARFEVRKYKKRVIILDGAHNLQKVGMLLDNLSFRYPNRKFNVAYASSKKRNPLEMLDSLKSVADKFYLTKYSVFAEDPERGAIDFTDYSHGLDDARIINDIDELINIINKSSESWLVTGSFFLVSDIGAHLSE